MSMCICNEEDADKAVGIKTDETNIENAELNKKGYILTAKTIHELFGCTFIATTFRKSFSAGRNGWSAMLYDAKTVKEYFSNDYDIQIVDRVGSGDSFAAGLIYAMAQNMCYQDAIEFATSASCLKHTIQEDYNRTTADDVMKLVQQGGSGRVEQYEKYEDENIINF